MGQRAVPAYRLRAPRLAGLVLLVSITVTAQAQTQDAGTPVYTLPQVNVIGLTPVQGLGIDANKVPANVQTLDNGDLYRPGSPSLPDALDRRLGSASTSDSVGNPFGASLNLRGFAVSPVLGEPQGLAVYQNGMRLNQPFGDIVLWDLVPNFAINRAQVIPGANPVFGLNALGGAVSLEMKNGFNFSGGSAEASGGSFGRLDGTTEYGTHVGNVGYYAGGRGFYEDGWREHSPSKLAQSYADITVRKDALELGFSFTYAASALTGNGATPADLLAQDRAAVFTTPDTSRDQLASLAIHGAYDVSDTFSIQGNTYYQHVIQHQINGDATGDSACAGTPTQLCSNSGTPLFDRNGNPVPVSVGGNGALNLTDITTDGVGASLQGTQDRDLFDRRNILVVGNAIDYGRVTFASSSEIGALSTDRAAIGSGIFLGGSDFNTQLQAENIYYGLYASDTYALTKALSVTAAGRFNVAQLSLHDQLGTALTSTNEYQRFNPSLGLTYQLTPGANVYANYSEANRIPTAAELACADPTQPCRFPNAFVSDPPLQQVVSRSIETGLRGGFAPVGGDSRLNWSAAAFGTRNSDDIIFVSSGPVIGSGFYQNAGTTQRVGLELAVDGRVDRWSAFASYGLVRATFESALSILSSNNPAADANGNIYVRPGDRMPNIPLQSLKWGVGYALTEHWSVAGDWIAASSRILRGDESNQQAPIPGYFVTNVESTYRLAGAEVFARVNNLFDQHYDTFGIYGDPTTVPGGYTDTRFLTPAPPRAAWLGARVKF